MEFKNLKELDNLYHCPSCFIFTPRSESHCVACHKELPEEERRRKPEEDKNKKKKEG